MNDTRICVVCNKEQQLTEFHKRLNGYVKKCKTCCKLDYKQNREKYKKACKVYYDKIKNTPEYKQKQSNRSKKRNLELKKKILNLHGTGLFCNICGVLNIEFLSLDHINGGGRIHRKQKHCNGIGFYYWLLKQPIKIGEYRTLCYNCQYETLSKKSWDELSSSGKNHRRLVIKIRDGYGNCCKNCGETNTELMTVQHINNDGAEHRKKFNGTALYRDLVKRNFPPEIELWCWNCNCAKGFFGYVPEKRIYNEEIHQKYLNSKKQSGPIIDDSYLWAVCLNSGQIVWHYGKEPPNSLAIFSTQKEAQEFRDKIPNSYVKRIFIDKTVSDRERLK